MKKIIYNNSLILSITWALIIFGVCATPGQLIPTVSWLDLLSFDKLVHASIFFTLCSLLFIEAIKKEQSKQTRLIYFFACIAYGGLLELMQAKYFSNRSGDWQDVIANSFGCVMALLLYKKIKLFFSPSS